MTISQSDFEQIEMRAGTIIHVEEFPEARKPAWKLTIDFGSYGTRRSSAQLKDLYQKEQLLNRQVIAVVNFPPKQIAGFMSECLVLGVVGSAGVVLLQPDRPVNNGDKIS